MVIALFTIVASVCGGVLLRMSCYSSLLFHGLASIACLFPFLSSCTLMGMLVLWLWTGIGKVEGLSCDTQTGDGSHIGETLWLALFWYYLGFFSTLCDRWLLHSLTQNDTFPSCHQRPELALFFFHFEFIDLFANFILYFSVYDTT